VRRHITVALAVAASLLLAAPAQAAPPASDPPGGLRVTGVTTTTVGLAWNAASGATGYQVLRGTPTTSLAVVASLGTSTTYTDTGRSPGTTYVYAVATVRKTKVSPPSATVTVTTLPAAPTGVTATALSWDRVQVRWSASSGATSYEVRRDGHAVPLHRPCRQRVRELRRLGRGGRDNTRSPQGLGIDDLHRDAEPLGRR
jgi:hypothetical protein